MLYLNDVKRRLRAIWDGLFPSGFRRSPMLPFLVVFALIGIPTAGWLLHISGNFHKIKSNLDGDSVVDTPRPGGLGPIELKVAKDSNSQTPQFLSATILPGLGMDVLQLTAFIPGRGVVQLLQAPTLQQMADGTAGSRSAGEDMRGAIELPWAGGLTGNPSPVGTTMTSEWRGKQIEVPTDPEGPAGVARGGLIARRGADGHSVNTERSLATAYFKATNFNDHWLSSTETIVNIGLFPKTMELVVTVNNKGNDPDPVGIGWHPHFSIPDGKRRDVSIKLPSGEIVDVTNRTKGDVSGKFTPVPAETASFVGHAAPLGASSLEAILAHLVGSSGSGASVEIIDAKDGYGIRMTAISKSVRELTFSAPADQNYIAMGMQTNYEDPLSKNWTSADPGLTTLDPGEPITFHVRLEIFAVARP